ncbi:MAG: DMT family transporter [Gammaproteobacteria bacterium]|uniref:DMT family transporter n=1 Tax=Rhodoferax sp. TaxID=50421 RepID=UPI00182E99B2|nr:DMT family transporter [Rhodoferax sp.]MBU3899616.1 DMT family transporter [Gammaproteobacteria bacterium]MBA3056584.1 DMT family transporter [Rhodoferax sp.]MBU3998947.1 DMT family transporter [Gammaproteobacteria bacterium]MBU4018092.1 DMT family transporter [Gammaproteobacteria bacterium]MBU4080217.1 DMT family transporter [Gammaproteobacteria bacterium]
MPAVFVLIWSTGFIVARYGMPHAPPLKFLVVRYALSIACFLPWIVLARVKWPSSREQWTHLAVTGIFMHAGYLGGVWAAVKLGMGSGLSSLIVGLQPVLTALWLAATGGKIASRQWLGLVLGFVGLVLVVSRKFGHGGEADWVNMSLAIGALLCITIGTLYQKRFVTPCDVRSANTVQLGAALLVTLPLALLEVESMRWNAELVGAMAWSVIGLTLGGSSLLYLLIQRGAAASVTSLMYLVPPVTALIAWALFDEPITVITVIGTLLTAFGVALVVRQPRLVSTVRAL